MEKTIVVARCFVIENKHILLLRRAPGQRNEGLWEGPGGKKRPEETLFDAQTREVQEESGLWTRPLTPISCVESYLITDGTLKGFSYVRSYGIAKVIGGKLALSKEHDLSKWVQLAYITTYALTPETRTAVRELWSHLERWC